MGRHLIFSVLAAALLTFAATAEADNPAPAANPAPTAATATHAISTVSAPTTNTAAPAASAVPTASAPAVPPVTPAATSTTPVATVEPAVAPAAATTAPPAASTVAMPAQINPSISMPTRGMSMANVEHIFGAPQEKIPAVPDPGTKLHPPITRWVYPDYVVYFEYNYVVHSVLKTHPFSSGVN